MPYSRAGERAREQRAGSWYAARVLPSLSWLAGGLVVVMAWIAYKRFVGVSETSAHTFVADRLRTLGRAAGWDVDADGTRIVDPDDGTVLARVEKAYEYGDDGTSLEIPGLRAAVAFAVWLREPPDSAVARWGEEVPTGDVVFDARFSLLTRTRSAILMLDTDARAALLDLETPSLVTDDGRVLLLLPGVPDVKALRRAKRALAIVRSSFCA